MLSPEERELIDVADGLLRERAPNDNHSVAAAARDRDGRIHSGMNVYHFTGGPCAELTVLGVAAALTDASLTTMVAVRRERGVVPPCGRCRQVMFDYFPEISVILPGDEVLPVADLLPSAYRREP